MRDMKEKGREGSPFRRVGERNHNAKLTAAAVMDIRQGGMTLKQITEAYGISMSVASSVRRGKTWKHVTAG